MSPRVIPEGRRGLPSRHVRPAHGRRQRGRRHRHGWDGHHGPGRHSGSARAPRDETDPRLRRALFGILSYADIGTSTISVTRRSRGLPVDVDFSYFLVRPARCVSRCRRSCCRSSIRGRSHVTSWSSFLGFRSNLRGTMTAARNPSSARSSRSTGSAQEEVTCPLCGAADAEAAVRGARPALRESQGRYPVAYVARRAR